MSEELPFPAWEAEKWQDIPENPLVQPVVGEKPKAVVGDPQVILPGEFDDKWHMFTWGSGEGGGHFYRFDSFDGVAWEFVADHAWHSSPPYMMCDGKRWIAYYSHHASDWSNDIQARTSEDLVNWSEPVDIIAVEFDWENEGKKKQVRNPNLVMLPDGKYRLYYSGGTVHMDDMGFEEPKHIGFAESDDPLGPFEKHPSPIISPDEKIWYRNYGAGGFRVYRYGEYFLGMENGTYLDEEKRSRSAIDVLLSKDGIQWHDAPYNPIILPGEGWKKALVYQLDLRFFEDKLWLFYNARDEWMDGIERIGCSVLEWDGPKPEKMWKVTGKRD